MSADRGGDAGEGVESARRAIARLEAGDARLSRADASREFALAEPRVSPQPVDQLPQGEAGLGIVRHCLHGGAFHLAFGKRRAQRACFRNQIVPRPRGCSNLSNHPVGSALRVGDGGAPPW